MERSDLGVNEKIFNGNKRFEQLNNMQLLVKPLCGIPT